MHTYIARRLLLMVPTLLGITFILFSITRLAPVDTVNILIGEVGYEDPELKAHIKEQFGLSSSIPEQYCEVGRRDAARRFRHVMVHGKLCGR